MNRGDVPKVLSWGKNLPKHQVDQQLEYKIEQAVSKHIRSMHFLWMNVDDPPGKESKRKFIERNAVALLSNAGKDPIDLPSEKWLGKWADHELIQESGLWNVHHGDETYEPEFLVVMEKYVERTGL